MNRYRASSVTAGSNGSNRYRANSVPEVSNGSRYRALIGCNVQSWQWSCRE